MLLLCHTTGWHPLNLYTPLSVSSNFSLACTKNTITYRKNPGNQM